MNRFSFGILLLLVSPFAYANFPLLVQPVFSEGAQLNAIPLDAQSQNESVIRKGYIRFDTRVLELGEPIVTVTPFADKSFTLSLTNKQQPQADVTVFTGNLLGDQMLNVIVIKTTERYVITFTDNNSGFNYEISGNIASEIGTVKELDSSLVKPLLCGVSDSPSHPNFGMTPSDLNATTKHFSSLPNLSGMQPNDRVHIDLMFVYDQDALTWLNTSSYGNKTTFQQQAIAKLNNAMTNSQLNIEFHLTHQMDVNFSLPKKCSSSLSQATLWMANPNYYNSDFLNDIQYEIESDKIRKAKKDHHADLVTFFTKTAPTCGTGGQAGQSAPNAIPNTNTSFSALNIAAALGHTSSLVHEIGHNFGAAHNAGNRGPNRNFGNYAAGWYFKSVTANKNSMSVMAYPKFTNNPNTIYKRRLAIFSSPDVEFEGAIIGDRNGGDNRRVLIETAKYIANYEHNPTEVIDTVSLDEAVDVTPSSAITTFKSTGKAWFGQKTLFSGDNTEGDTAQSPRNFKRGDTSSLYTNIKSKGKLTFSSRAVRHAFSNTSFDLYINNIKVKSLITTEARNPIKQERKFTQHELRIDNVPAKVEWRLKYNTSNIQKGDFWNMSFVDNVNFSPDEPLGSTKIQFSDSFE